MHLASSENEIDLLFDRKDDAVTICEIKYSDRPFIMDKQCVETLKRVIDVYKLVTRSKKQIFIAIIQFFQILK